MWSCCSRYKKFTYYFAFTIVLAIFAYVFFIPKNVESCYAENLTEEEITKELEGNIGGILDSTDTSDLDEFLEDDFGLDFFEGLSFKDLAKKVLSGEYFLEYDSLFSAVVSSVRLNIKKVLSFFLSLLCLVLIFEIFNNFCTDKYSEIKKVVKIVFSLALCLMIAFLLKGIAEMVSETVSKIFNFSKILFPILLSLVLLSGASGTYSVYSSLSVFLLNTGSYLFMYVLLPLAISIMLLSLSGSVLNAKRFSKINGIFKSIFKYIIIAFLSVFGIFSVINAASSGMSDGVTYKVTRFMVKSYVPVLGGYLSDGFDFVRTCAVMVKNSFGICSIFVLIFMVAKPILLYIVYALMFKILSVFTLFTGNNYFSDVFENVSKSISYFITVLVGIFMCLFVFIYLLILSVSVVWWFIELFLL